MTTRKPLAGENEGKLVMASGRRFLVKDGRRIWLDQPPARLVPDLLSHA
jgi:hypothetical protein